MVDRVLLFWLDIAICQSLRGGSYIHTTTSGRVRNNTVIYVNNTDDHCLKWALGSALFPEIRKGPHNTQRMMAWTLQKLMPPLPSPRFQKSKNSLVINIFGWDKGVIEHCLSKRPKDIARINLLLIEKGGKLHYPWIKDIDRLSSGRSACSSPSPLSA